MKGSDQSFQSFDRKRALWYHKVQWRTLVSVEVDFVIRIRAEFQAEYKDLVVKVSLPDVAMMFFTYMLEDILPRCAAIKRLIEAKTMSMQELYYRLEEFVRLLILV